MVEILWGSWQESHITQRHGVSASEFEQAWLDREDLEEGDHPDHGRYTVSTGYTDDLRGVRMIWR